MLVRQQLAWVGGGVLWLTGPRPEPRLLSTSNIKTACDRDECSFNDVQPTERLRLPLLVRWGMAECKTHAACKVALYPAAYLLTSFRASSRLAMG